MKSQASGVVETQPANAADPAQLRVADQKPPVVLLVRLTGSSPLFLGAVVVDDDRLVKADSVSQFDAAERLVDGRK